MPRTKTPQLKVSVVEPGRSAPPSGAWKPLHSYLALSALTLICLLPFIGKAFHVDDTLFVWAGQHIVKSPGDPYGFELNWGVTVDHMWHTTKNPPLACYYAAMVGAIAG